MARWLATKLEENICDGARVIKRVTIERMLHPSLFEFMTRTSYENVSICLGILSTHNHSSRSDGKIEQGRHCHYTTPKHESFTTRTSDDVCVRVCVATGWLETSTSLHAAPQAHTCSGSCRSMIQVTSEDIQFLTVIKMNSL